MIQPTWATADGRVQLYMGDCLEILPQFEAGSVDVIVTDPPWELSENQVSIRGNGVAPRRQESQTLRRGAVGEWTADAIRTIQLTCDGDCLFLAGYKELADLIKTVDGYRGTFVWHKPNGAPSCFYPAKLDCSFIVWSARKSVLYGYQHWPSMVFSFPFPQAGCMASERLIDKTGKAVHPCQGPVALYSELLRPFPPSIVADPYMGTGTCGVAAIVGGHGFIGIERDESYFAIAVKRIEAELNRMPLFEPPPQIVRQQEFKEHAQ